MIMPVIAADMAGQPPLHERAEGFGSGGLKHKVEMVGHEAEAEELDWMFGFGDGEQVEEGAIILLFVKDRRAAVAPIDDMIGIAGDLSSGNARHGGTILP